ncbi:Panacea domain-containing protein [Mucilaginibacter pedocola]|uniref:Antitoxin SocA-like Panacea domain-containing protein n=1 Tax=Mucilaginibacter pedocola TaxID=1792845 RepID=A0A1S9PIX6_9SPHI|nr:type II toxin-antitoxin system antitoxin SocA domain-containing protein [Mucilaginibacter pedocola]OOQ60921.1 hypothetical protein BC343_23455 [Mucilaginibacter pedocola]
MPYSAITIAAAFVQKGIDEGNPMTQMKLQKLVYFAHGYNLAKRNEPLINEEVQAWKFGPVIPAIYNDYKRYGREPISSFDQVESVYCFGFNDSVLDKDAIEALDYTWKATAHLSASDLSAWTHKHGSPWAEVYNPKDMSIPIKKESIRQYFRNFLFPNE